MLIDSASTDNSIHLFEQCSAKIISIRREDFDHGGTRNLAFQYMDADIYVFFTQDSIPAYPFSIENLVRALSENAECGIVYGRQVAGENASAFARHARLYNYPSGNSVVIKSKLDIPKGYVTVNC